MKLSFFADFLIVPILIVASLLFVSFASALCLIVLGIFVWTFAEYWLHRLSHVFLLVKQHAWHHEHPSSLMTVSSWAALPIYAGLMLVLWATFGLSTASALFCGLMTGYFAFIVTHYAVHHLAIGPAHVLYRAKLRHLAHHRGTEANFGVLTSLWDHVFQSKEPRWPTQTPCAPTRRLIPRP